MVSIKSFCLGAILLPAVVLANLNVQTCTRENSVTIQPGATAQLGGILWLSDSGEDGYGCQPPHRFMQAVEGIRWVLDLLNKINETVSTEYLTDYYVPGITLGMELINNCGHNPAAALADLYPEIQAGSDECSRQNQLMFGVVGPTSSDESISATMAGLPFNIPFISFQATSPSLTQSGNYPNFLRTVAPDDDLMEVIVEVMKHLDWKYVAVVYESSAFGIASFEEFHTRYTQAGFCLTASFSHDPHDVSDEQTDSILTSLLSTKATGVLYFGLPDFITALIQRADSRMPESGQFQWLIYGIAVDAVFPATTYQNGIITVSVASRFIVEFEDHWIRLDPINPSPENPWYQEWYELRNNCSVNPGPGERDCRTIFGTNLSDKEREQLLRSDFVQDQYVEPAIMSVFTYANALRRAQMAKCPGVRGPCAALMSMSREEFFNDYIKTVDFTFTSDERVPSLASNIYEPYLAAKTLSYDDKGDIENPSFYIWNYNNIETGAGDDSFKFRRVGTFINGKLDMNLNNVGMYSESRTQRLVPLPKSLCPDTGCAPCIGLPADTHYYYEPGDIVISGIFSLHNMGPTSFTCGGLKDPNQIMFMEAMIYALDEINNNNALLPGIRLGGLGIDDCSSSAIGQAFISQVQRGELLIHDDGNDILDPYAIHAYIGAHTSPLTIPFAHLMNSLERPLVSYRAGGYDLDLKSRYPYYVRANPGIVAEIRAIILLLKSYGWMHVQMVVSDTYYSNDAGKTFREMAAREGICIVAQHEMSGTLESAVAAVRGLSIGSAAPTVALLDTYEHHFLLQALAANPSARSRIALIATSRWGTNEMIVKDLEDVANGVITLSPRHSTLQSFLNYLGNFRYNTHAKNPWFNEWYSRIHQCTSASCNNNFRINDGAEFEALYEVGAVINSVRAIAYALQSLLNMYCPGNTGVCSDFTTATDIGQKFVEELYKVSFTIEDMTAPNTFRFTGDSVDIGFDIFNYRDSAYERVGGIEPWRNEISLSGVTLFGNKVPSSISTTCAQPCLECLYMFEYQDYLYIPGNLMIGAIFNIHYAGDGPFSCGDIRIENGAVYSEIVAFAIDRVNRGLASVSLDNGLRLGLLGFDGCSNPTRALALLNRASTNLRSIVPGSVSSQDIMAWLTYDSETTEESSLFLQKLGIPLVSPGATDPRLVDKTMYTTLFRTVPSDIEIARGMAQFANEMDWRYVLVVNAPYTSSREAANRFRQFLNDFGVCIVAQYEFETDGNMEVILRSLTGFDTHVVAVFGEPDQYIDEFLKARRDRNIGQDLIFIANRRWQSAAADSSLRLENSVFFEMQSPTINEFYTYLQTRDVLSSNNPWLGTIYEEIFDCDLPGSFFRGSDCQLPQRAINSGHTKDIWTLTTIHAVSAITEGLHRTLVEKCGNGYLSVCFSFLHDADTQERFMHHMDQLSFSDIVSLVFQFISRESNRGFLMYRYQLPGVPVNEASLSSGGVLKLINEAELKARYVNVMSECPGDCFVCHAFAGDLRDFTIIPGRIYIVGLFDVHKKGSTPFTCGEINDHHGMQLLEAFHYAIEYVNRGEGIFRDKLSAFVLGGIGLDTCQSPARAANLVANIHSGNFELVKEGTTVNTRRIDAYIGPMNTESSIRVADILSQLQMPQISYGATGMDLSDQIKYDYFLRSVPADDKQARAIVSYLNKFKYNNIQVIHSSDEIGEPGAEEFKRLAILNMVCIKEDYTLGMTDDMNAEADDIINRIVQNTNAEVIVLWMKDPLPILRAAENNFDARTKLLFIGTDKWGAHPSILKDDSIRRLLTEQNLVILDVETADIPEFDEYLESKIPVNYTRNPWYQEYFESHFDCVWEGPIRPTERLCDRAASIPRSDSYVQDPYVLYVINAVFSAAKAIDRTIKEFCVTGSADFGVCNRYRTSGERKEKVLSQLKQVNFVDDTHQPFFYTEDGQSDRGFHIYNVTVVGPNRDSFIYHNIGSYNDSHFLKLDIRYDSDYKAECDPYGRSPNMEHCVCPFEPDIPSRFMKKDNEGRGLTLAYVGDIHQAHPDNKFACGPINTGVDLERLLAFFYALDRINSNADFVLPDSIRLDGIALDSCTNGLRLGQDIYNLLSGNKFCDSDESGTDVSPSSIVGFVVDKDRNALPVSSMLTHEGITTISPTASHGMLDDPYLHSYFIRTIGGNKEQARVILEIIKSNNWNLFSVIYSDSAEHGGALYDLLSEAQSQSICASAAAPLAMDASLDDARFLLSSVTVQSGMRAIVLFVDPSHVRLLMEASRLLRLTGQYVWIFPPTWSTHMADISGFEPELKGAIVIQHRSGILEDFARYMMQMTFTNRLGIPDDWFEDIYENIHKCRIFNLERRPSVAYPRICSEDEVITPEMIRQDMSILHVILSVYSFALGLNDIPICSGNIDIAACLQLQEQKSDLIYRGILGINLRVFPDELGNGTFDFTYDLNGNGQAGYFISYFKTTDSGGFGAQQLGTYTTRGLSNIDWDAYRRDAFGIDSSSFNRIDSSCPLSTICECQGPSGPESGGNTWNFITSGSSGGLRVGESYRDPDTEEIYILTKPDIEDRFSDTWGIIVAVLAGIGAVLSMVLFIYLLVMYPVRGGTSILGYILSFGIFLLYLMVFPFIYHADEKICALRRFGLGLVYAIVYSSLLIKLVDCWRVRGKNESYSAKYSKLGRPAGLFFVTVFLVLIQMMINAEWLILEEPDMEYIFYKNMMWPKCTPEDFYNEGLVLSLSYIMVLIVFSFFLGIVTFTSVQNHRESRWILSIFTLTIPCWVIWCLVAVIGAEKVRDAAVAVGLLINATIILFCVPIRKLYLLRRYNTLIEEEDKLAREGDYDSTYGNQYDNTPHLQDTGSVRGSSVGGQQYSNRGAY